MTRRAYHHTPLPPVALSTPETRARFFTMYNNIMLYVCVCSFVVFLIVTAELLTTILLSSCCIIIRVLNDVRECLRIWQNRLFRRTGWKNSLPDRTYACIRILYYDKSSIHYNWRLQRPWVSTRRVVHLLSIYYINICMLYTYLHYTKIHNTYIKSENEGIDYKDQYMTYWFISSILIVQRIWSQLYTVTISDNEFSRVFTVPIFVELYINHP